MALQIFPPTNSILGHDGLYKVRRWVFAIWILLPCFTAALAFANPDGAYQAQGAFCWLPIRPFWYRLALSWVPRYLIWLYIMWVAIRIYSHVGYEFRVFGQERDRSSSTDISAQSSAERGAVEKAVREHRSQVRSDEKMNDEIAPDDASMPGPMPLHSPPNDSGSPAHVGRRMSLPAWHSPFGPDADMSITPTARSNPTSRRGSRQIAPGVLAEDFMAPPGFDFTRPRGSVSTITSMPPSINGAHIDPILAPIEEGRGSCSTASTTHTDIGARALRQRRRAIQRQLRILFIYPVVYMAMWLIPFVVHCMSYSDYSKSHFPTLTALLVLPNVHGLRRRQCLLLARAALATHTRQRRHLPRQLCFLEMLQRERRLVAAREQSAGPHAQLSGAVADQVGWFLAVGTPGDLAAVVCSTQEFESEREYLHTFIAPDYHAETDFQRSEQD
jgi:G protein-coupled receptor GPR1